MNEEIRRVYEFGAFRLDVEERVLLRAGQFAQSLSKKRQALKPGRVQRRPRWLSCLSRLRAQKRATVI